MNETQKRVIGRRIAQIRDKSNKTLEEFGQIIDNATKSNVSKWEKGEVLPNRKRLKLIAQYDGIHLNELLYGDMKGFAFSIFFDEIDRFMKKYQSVKSANMIIKYLDTGEAITLFENWFGEYQESITFDDEAKIRKISNSIIMDNIESNRNNDIATEEVALHKTITRLYEIKLNVKEDFFQGFLVEKNEIELALKDGMTQELYNAVDSILEEAALKLIMLKNSLTD